MGGWATNNGAQNPHRVAKQKNWKDDLIKMLADDDLKFAGNKISFCRFSRTLVC